MLVHIFLINELFAMLFYKIYVPVYVLFLVCDVILQALRTRVTRAISLRNRYNINIKGYTL